MASKTRKIPQASWDHHKETILSLYLTSDLSVDELVQTMEKEHGLSATLSQYEAQLRVWNARKNLKRHEWEAILQKLDRLSSRGKQARVVISGHPVSMDRVHRARRHCKSDPHPRKRRRVELDSRQVIDNADESVAIEVQTPDGNWTLDTNIAGEDVVSDQQQTGIDGVPELLSQDDLAGADSGQPSLFFDIAEPLAFPELSSFHTPNHVPSDQYLGGKDNAIPWAVEFPAQISHSCELQENATSQTSKPAESSLESGDLIQLPWGTIALEGGLLFEKFESELASRNFRLITQPSLMQDSRLLSGSQRLVAIFLNDVVAAMTKANRKSVCENFYGASLTLKTLETILPASQQSSGHYSVARFQQEIFDVELCRILLFSAANGFIGMNNTVLFKVIFKFLHQNSNITALLSQLFRDEPGHTGKGLAENLFRAAIESGDHKAIRFFLTTKLVDVDATVCIVDRQKYTPLERAAELQHLEAVRELISFRPDVNLTFLADINPGFPPRDRKGGLGGLIHGICPKGQPKRNHNTFTQEYLRTVDALTDAGAKVRTTFIQTALAEFVRMDLAKKLLRGLEPADHSEAISSHVLHLLSENLQDEEATEFFSKIISDCKATGCNQCLSQHSERVNWAIIVGAKRGHIQFVRAHFKHAKCPTQLLAAAIRGGSNELVQFVLAQTPDMHAPASNIDEPPWAGFADDHNGTTPLAEAIDAKEEALIRELEMRGALLPLGTKPRFASTITAAASVGDIEYVKKVLLLYPQFEGDDISSALDKAIHNKHEDVVRLLLDAGAQFERYSLEVYELGSASLSLDIASTYPAAQLRTTSDFDKRPPRSTDIDLLNLSARLGVLDGEFLTNYLGHAAQKGDRVLLRRLLELGANTIYNDGSVFGRAAAGDLDILKILFESVPLTKTSRPRFGTDALVKAIEENCQDVEALEIFIACGAVDFKSMPIYGSVSPLGAAIVKDVKSCRSDFPLTTRLLDAGCDINGVVCVDSDNRGRKINKTSLLKAIEMKSKPMVQFLIKRGAQVNREATRGIRKTPIQAAAEIGSLDIIELLLQSGADINEKPAQFHGGTALQFAAMGGYCNVAVFLLDHGADLFALPSTFGGQWPIEGAAEHGRLDMIQLLWNASIGGFPIEQCRRAIELAKMNGHGACVDLIRELAVLNGIMPTLEGCA